MNAVTVYPNGMCKKLSSVCLLAPVAPDPVKITEITNTSMVVTWQPPKSLNGALRYYDVFYDSKFKRLDVNTNVRKIF